MCEVGLAQLNIPFSLFRPISIFSCSQRLSGLFADVRAKAKINTSADSPRYTPLVEVICQSIS